MPELALQEKEREEATTKYSDKFIKVNFPNIDLRHLQSSLWHSHSRTPSEPKFDVCITTAVDQEERKASVIDWPRKEDPFTQADLLDHEDNRVQELIFQIRKSLFISNQESIANRLITLFNDAKEEDSSSPGITVNSLLNFYDFLILNDDLRCPTISLTPDNNIYATWKGEQDRLFSAHFISNGDVHFVIFKPNDKHPGRQIRLSGIATSDILMEILKSESLLDWIAK